MSGKKAQKEKKKEPLKEKTVEEVEFGDEDDETQYANPVSLSLEIEPDHDLEKAMQESRQQNFEFVVAPLSHPGYQRDLARVVSRPELLKGSDTILGSSSFASGVVGVISTGDLDSSDESKRNKAKKVNFLVYSLIVKRFLQEINWATNFALPALILRINSHQIAHIAQVVNQIVQNLLYTQVWICVPLTVSSLSENNPQDSKMNDPWEWWNNLRTLCENNQNIYVGMKKRKY